MVIHNHPNGSKKASKQDIASATTLQVFGDIFTVVLRADICIGKNGWTNCLKKYDDEVDDNQLPYV